MEVNTYRNHGFISVLTTILLCGVFLAGMPDQAQAAASVSGVEFKDSNGNGVKDAGEPGLAGWTIYVDYNDNGMWDSGEPYSTTDRNGAYTINGINPGTYKIREVVLGLWTCSYPNLPSDKYVKPVISTQCFYQKTFTSSSLMTNSDFGSRMTSTIDPAWSYNEWPDHEIFVAKPASSAGLQDSYYTVTTNSSLDTATTLSIIQATLSSDGHDRALAAGHFIDPKNQSAMTAVAVGQTLTIKWPDYTQGIWSAGDLFPASNGCVSFMDIAAGDLDAGLDAEMAPRDELVVAYAVQSSDNQLPVRIVVLDFSGSSQQGSQPTQVTTVLASSSIKAGEIITGSWKCAENALGVTTGDFDGDSHDEIAVGYQLNTNEYMIDIFRYTTTTQDNGRKVYSLALVDSQRTTLAGANGNTYVSLDIAAADLDGNGRSEVTVAYSRYDGTASHDGVVFSTFRFSATPSILPAHVAGLNVLVSPSSAPPRVQIAPGLFGLPPEFEGSVHPNLNARQLAFAYNVGDSNTIQLGVIGFWPDGDLLASMPQYYPYKLQGHRFQLAAGGFKGLRTSDDYYWTAALATWTGYDYLVRFFHPTQPLILSQAAVQWSSKTVRGEQYSPGIERHPILAFDPDGNTLFLGQPLEIDIENIERFKFILQEPPKHTYWDPNCYISNSCGGVKTVSRWDNFYLEIKENGTESFSSTYQYTTDVTNGWTAGEKFDISKSFGGPLKPLEIGGSINSTFAKDYTTKTNDHSSYYVEHSWKFSRATNRDDVVVGETNSYIIWRYPLYGYAYADSVGNPAVAYMDFVMPQEKSSLDTPVGYGASNVEGWEPPWENGNILSYPKNDLAFRHPRDLGSYRIPCTSGSENCVKVSKDNEPEKWEKEINESMAWGVMYADATGGSQEVSMTQNEGAGHDQSYGEKFTANVNVNAFISKKGLFGVGPNVKLEASGGFNHSDSWCEATTSENKTSSTRALYLTSPAPTTIEESYAYYPLLYPTVDGAMRLAFAVDPLPAGGQGNHTWLSLYGDTSQKIGKPDPALNLPGRFIPTFNVNNVVNGWKPQPDEYYRNEIRGFFIKQSQLDPNLDPEVDGYPLLGRAPMAGEEVRLEVMVNNYTLSEINGVVPILAVYFYATATDLFTSQTKRQEIGTVYLTNLRPREPQVAAINWTPEAFGTGGQIWRVHVVLDPDNLIDEIYDSDNPKTYCLAASCTPEELIDPGQNNYGFREVTIMNPLPSDSRSYHARDISLKNDALAAFSRKGTLESGTVQSYVGRQVSIRIKVNSDRPTVHYARVVLYDGDPAKGGVQIARKNVLPGVEGSTFNEVWVPWTPESTGLHNLYAVLLESKDDLRHGNDIATLKLVVIKEPGGPKK